MTFEPPQRALAVANVKAPLAFLCAGKPFESFIALRDLVHIKTGHDFLAVCGDMLRTADFVSTKKGVANRSWHKTGRAFDYNQDDKHYVIEPERIDGRIYFRTWLLCDEEKDLGGEDISGHLIWQKGTLAKPAAGRYFDFTEAAAALGYHRIPAWRDWGQKEYSTSMEFWHYQCDERLSWNEAMKFLYIDEPIVHTITENFEGKELFKEVLLNHSAPHERVIGRNDRGPGVKLIQTQLVQLGLLSASEVDSVYGLMTFSAVAKFQKAHGLQEDGLVGSLTRQVLGNEVAALSIRKQ